MFAERVLEKENGLEKLKKFLMDLLGTDKIVLNPGFLPVKDGRITLYYSYINERDEVEEDRSYVLNDMSMDKNMVKLFSDIFGEEYKTWRYSQLDALFNGII